jgi:hypothetical protein
MCMCDPAVNAMNRACPSCQAEYTEWSAALEEVGIIGPVEHEGPSIQRGGPRSREMRKHQAQARHHHRLKLEAAANAAYYSALGEIA